MALRQFVLADESGTHEGSDYCIVAGYRGSPGQWDIFNAAWRKILKAYGVQEFHSNVFFNRKRIPDPNRNPYIKWTDRKAKAFLGELLEVISARRIYPVGCSVNVRDFDSCSYGERCVLAGYEAPRSRRKSRRPAPYHLAFREMLLDAIDKTHPDTALHFIVALQEQYQQRAVEAFWLTKKYANRFQSDQLRGIAFEEPVNWAGLQAADLLARHWYNCSIRIWAGKGLNRENISTMNILTHRRADMPYCDAAAIERMFAHAGVSEHDRQVLRTIKEPRRDAD